MKLISATVILLASLGAQAAIPPPPPEFVSAYIQEAPAKWSEYYGVWKKYFPGDPGLIEPFDGALLYQTTSENHESLVRDTLGLIKPAPPECPQGLLAKVVRDVWSYREAILRRGTDGEPEYLKITSLLEAQVVPACRDAAYRAYFISSLATSFAYRFGNGLTEPRLMLAGAFLANADRVKPSVEGLGVSKPLWGAYSCTDTTLYLSTKLRPLDAGATFAHELNHFLSDKAIAPGPFWSGWNSSAWRGYVIADESISYSASAFQQIMVREYGGTRARPIRTRNDLTLYTPNGVIDRRTCHNIFDWVCGNSGLSAKDSVFGSLFQSLSEVPVEIGKFYFTGNGTNARADLDEFRAQIEPLRGPFSLPVFGYDTATDASQFAGGKRIFGSSYKGLGIELTLSDLKFLDQAITQPSALCSAFQSAAHRGDLAGYAGIKPTSPTGEDDPFGPLRPSGDGVKSSVIHPCLKIPGL